MAGHLVGQRLGDLVGLRVGEGAVADQAAERVPDPVDAVSQGLRGRRVARCRSDDSRREYERRRDAAETERTDRENGGGQTLLHGRAPGPRGRRSPSMP